jgi:hypothetical protein
MTSIFESIYFNPDLEKKEEKKKEKKPKVMEILSADSVSSFLFN